MIKKHQDYNSDIQTLLFPKGYTSLAFVIYIWVKYQIIYYRYIQSSSLPEMQEDSFKHSKILLEINLCIQNAFSYLSKNVKGCVLNEESSSVTETRQQSIIQSLEVLIILLHYLKNQEVMSQKTDRVIFGGNLKDVDIVANSRLNVYAHIIKRRQKQSTNVLGIKKKYPNLYTKSSKMLGFGETNDQILQTLKYIITQYIQIAYIQISSLNLFLTMNTSMRTQDFSNFEVQKGNNINWLIF